MSVKSADDYWRRLANDPDFRDQMIRQQRRLTVERTQGFGRWHQCEVTGCESHAVKDGLCNDHFCKRFPARIYPV